MKDSSNVLMGRLMSENARAIFQKRARLIAHIRDILDRQGFIEVETPMLYPYPEIAPMEQFRVEDPTSQRTYYLRVCPTEHLKRLMAAGFEKVYEFSRNYRPGNLSNKHSPEFTSLECSQLSADYLQMMTLAETIVYSSIVEIKEASRVSVQGTVFDLCPPWQRTTVRDAILDSVGVDVLEVESLDELRSRVNDVQMMDIQSLDQAIDRLIEVSVLPYLTRPTFISEYPFKLGGPAQPNPADTRVKQRCEAFIGTLEIANMSTHLNDITLLRAWHAQTNELKRQLLIGDAIIDEPLFDALGLGLPHSAVVGIGIDRLMMLAIDANSIEDVILFPFALM